MSVTRSPGGPSSRSSSRSGTLSPMSKPAAAPHAPKSPPAPLPGTRPELLALHIEARRRRNAAPLGSEAWAEASDEVGRIEVELARIGRAMDPPTI